MSTRREFLKMLAAIPLVGPLIVGAHWPDDFAGGDTFTMRRVGECDVRALCRQHCVNSHKWRGHDSGKVQLLGVSGERDNDGTWDVRYEFARVKPILWKNPAGDTMAIPAMWVHGETDFNQFDFGEVVRG